MLSDYVHKITVNGVYIREWCTPSFLEKIILLASEPSADLPEAHMQSVLHEISLELCNVSFWRNGKLPSSEKFKWPIEGLKCVKL